MAKMSLEVLFSRLRTTNIAPASVCVCLLDDVELNPCRRDLEFAHRLRFNETLVHLSDLGNRLVSLVRAPMAVV
jgi:hypothetical protein